MVHLVVRLHAEDIGEVEVQRLGRGSAGEATVDRIAICHPRAPIPALLPLVAHLVVCVKLQMTKISKRLSPVQITEAEDPRGRRG